MRDILKDFISEKNKENDICTKCKRELKLKQV